MSFLKNLGEKAKATANVIGNKSQDMVEIGKLKVSITQTESEIKKLKFEIGEITFDAYSKSEAYPAELIEKICSDITGKFTTIEELNQKIKEIQIKTGETVEQAPEAQTEVQPEAQAEVQPEEATTEPVSFAKNDNQ